MLKYTHAQIQVPCTQVDTALDEGADMLWKLMWCWRETAEGNVVVLELGEIALV